MTTKAQQLDTRIEVVTPENIAFQYEIAGPFRRLPAYLIDLLIRTVVVVAIILAGLLALGWAGHFGIAVFIGAVIWFLMDWFYGGVFETFWNGQTPGKWMMGLRVLTVDGQPINALQAVLRNILRAVDGLPLMPLPMYIVGLVACSMNQKYQRLGDLACGTIVVVETKHRLHGLVRMEQAAIHELAAQLPAQIHVSRSMAKALASYVARRSFFAPGRRAEIASVLGEPLVSQYGLPANTNHDLLLCALYYRTFVGRGGMAQQKPAEQSRSAPSGPPRVPVGA
jgi:uncharacterized RDD family membrane protein YckC